MKVESNELIYAVKQRLPLEQIIRRKSLQLKDVSETVDRTGHSKMRKEDVLVTPQGNRFMKYWNGGAKISFKWEDGVHLFSIKEFMNWFADTFFKGELRTTMLTDIKAGKWKKARSLLSIEDDKTSFEMMDEGKYEVKGLIDHLIKYTQPILATGQTENVLREKIRDIVRKISNFVSIERVLLSKEWISQIRTGSNAGFPKAVTVTTIDPRTGKVTTDRERWVLREDLINEHLPRIEAGEAEDEMIFIALTRSQAGKSRLICGGDNYLKVFGAILIYAIMLSVGLKDHIAWGEHESIYRKIIEAMKAGKSVLSIDFSGLDTTFKRVWQIDDIYGTLLDKFTLDPTWTKIIKIYRQMLGNSYILYAPGRMVKVIEGLESGRPTTQFDDSILTCAVTEVFAETYGFKIVDYVVLGDDVIAIFEEDHATVIAAFESFTETLLTDTGLDISVDKSYPCDLHLEGAFGKFLQFYIYKVEDDFIVFGDWIRRIASLIYLERDSTEIKGYDSKAMMRSKNIKYGEAYLIRAIQICASLTPNLPGLMYLLAFISLFEKDLTNQERVTTAMKKAEDFRVMDDYEWMTSIYYNPEFIVDLIPKLNEFIQETNFHVVLDEKRIKALEEEEIEAEEE